MKKTFLTLAAFAALALAGCGSKEVSFDSLETARAQGKSNATWNAQSFRSANTQFANFSISVQTDSSMVPSCPQGDGWASVKLTDKVDPSRQVSLKCSTVSEAVSCLTETDFRTKPYSGDDGHCQPVSKVPFPIVKLEK